MRVRLIATEAVASAWHSRALVCPEVCRIGKRMEPAPTSTHAERERVYPAAVPPHMLLDELTLYMSPTGYALASRFESSATYMRHEGPNFTVALILALFFVLPAISVRTMVTVMEGGSRFALGGDDEQGRYDIRRWVDGSPPLQGT
jgi:hypothetical protein